MVNGSHRTLKPGLFLTGTLLLSACSGTPPTHLGAQADGHLAPCPDSPNCVHSRASDTRHAIAPLALGEHRWNDVQAALTRLPRVTLIRATDRYLHVEARSRIIRFVDDLELLLHPDTGQIEVRSAARLGYADFGVNRARIEDLRHALEPDTSAP